MRIVFICGSLEPGRDGVGDYTRCLANTLQQYDVKAGIIAWNDSWIIESDNDRSCSAGNVTPFLRLPSNWSTAKRLALANEWLESFQPDWISIQYVPFAFHSKGLPLRFSVALKELVKTRQVHIMFHELWVGMRKGVTVKERAWGWLQKMLAKYLLATLNPAAVHTQTRLYQLQLSSLGYKAKHLPLFANIFPVAIPAEKPSEEFNLVVFGSIHPLAPVDEFAYELAAYAASKGVHARVIFLGHTGNEKQRWIKAFEKAGIVIKIFDAQPAAIISEVLASAHIGISTTPIELIEKSGSAVAMLEHGLPVICVAAPWTARDFIIDRHPDAVLQYQPGNLHKLCVQPGTIPYGSNLEKVSLRFFEELVTNYSKVERLNEIYSVR